GSMGLAASANINPERDHPSLFEPVHGSAPDIAGKNRANPIGAIWSAALLLRHVGEEAAAVAIEEAIDRVSLQGDCLTAEIGGEAGTTEVGDAIAREVRVVLTA
ncbi:MAG: isocitrate/isopropylmalate family dehydrogenase, partial [Candidatus Dormibacteraeota bacterium]|nr:isocitrate/isopropylmalate family dehydrogenase [Candidatus Dormibacteraeota bacterium]